MIKSIIERVKSLQATGSGIEKTARYLNAEFEGCFYANKNNLWARYKENEQDKVRVIAQF